APLRRGGVAAPRARADRQRAAAHAGGPAGRAPLLAPLARHRRGAAHAVEGLAVMHRRRSFEVFTLSFLDTICCGFGAMILLLVLTEVGKPAALEESRKHLGGQVRLLEEQLNIIRGQTDELNRELVGSRETLERERGKLSSLAGDLSRIRGRYAGSREDAAVTNIIERQLVAGQEALTEEMQRLIAQRAQSPRTADIGGIPLDSEYVIFIIDTSSSMTSNHWEVNLGVVEELLSLYPHVRGLQVMNDQGTYMYEGTRGRWLSTRPSSARTSTSAPRSGAPSVRPIPSPAWWKRCAATGRPTSGSPSSCSAMSSPAIPSSRRSTRSALSTSPGPTAGGRFAFTPSGSPRGRTFHRLQICAFPP